MAIIQVSKIINRTGANVDLPQLDEGEIGFATDERKVYIGNDPILHPPADNETTTQTEILTEISTLNFSKIEGADNSSLNITELEDGQVLVADGHTWVNGGGNANVNINLGDIEKILIAGGQNGYVLQTDGLGKLSWASAGIVTYNIQSVTRANPAVVTTTEDNTVVTGIPVTITGVIGMTQLATAGEFNRNKFFPVKIDERSFALYKDYSATQPVDSTSFSPATNTSGLVTVSFYAAGTGSPGGANNQIQINDGAGGFFGSPNLSFNRLSSVLTLNGNLVAGTVTANLRGALTGPVGTITPNSGAFTSITATTTANITGNLSTAGNLNVTRNAFVTGNTTSNNLRVNNLANLQQLRVSGNVTSNLVPSSNVTFDLGNVTNRWKDLYLSGNTIYIGEQVITSDANGISLGGTSSSLTVASANLGNVATANTFVGRIATANQPNITNVGTLTSLTVAGSVNLGSVANLKIQGGQPDHVLTLKADGSNIEWRETQFRKTPPGGANFTVQFNNQNEFGGSNLFTFDSGTGVVTAVGFVGRGNNLSNIQGANVSGQVGNALIAGTVYTNAQPNITSVGNLTSLNVVNNASVGFNLSVASNLTVNGRANITGPISATSGNLGNAVVANFFIGSGNNLSNILAININGIVANANYAEYGNTVLASAQPNIRSVGSLTSLVVDGNISTGDATISNATIIGNLSAFQITSNTVINAVGNIRAGNLFSNNSIFANSGNVVANNITSFTDITAFANVAANRLTANNITATAGITSNTITTGGITASGPITSGSQTVAGTIVASGSVSAGNLNTTGVIFASGNANVGNLGTNNVIATANVTSNNASILGLLNVGANANVFGNLSVNGNIVTQQNVTANNISLTENATVAKDFTANTITSNTTIVANANITGGNLITEGSLRVTGSANVGNLNTNNVSALSNVSANNITSTFNISAASANVSGVANVGSLSTTSVTATGNVVGGNLATSGNLSVLGNTTVANIAANNITATGNVNTSQNMFAANFYWSNGVLFQPYNNTNVSSFLGVYTGNLSVGNITSTGNLLTTGNVTAANLSTSGVLTVNGNITSGNISSGIGTFTGNVSGNNISAANTLSGTRLSVSGNANVGNLGVAGDFSTAGNITGANINTPGSATVTGNLSANNATIAANLIAAGNINAGNLVVSNTVSGVNLQFNGNANVGPIRSTGNITGLGNLSIGNISTTGAVAATGNGTFGNIFSANGTFTGRLSAASFNLAGDFTVTGLITPSRGSTANSGLVFQQYDTLDSNRSASIKYFNIANTTTTTLEITNQNTSSDNIVISASGIIIANSNVDVTGLNNAAFISKGGLAVEKSVLIGANLTAANANLGNLVTANNFTGKFVRNDSNIDITNSGNVSIAVSNIANAFHISKIPDSNTVNVTVLGNLTASNLQALISLVAGNAYVGGNQLVGGDQYVSGNLLANSVLTSGNFTSEKTIIGGNLQTAGNLTAGNTTINGLLTAGNVTLTGNVQTPANVSANNIISNTVTVSGNLTAGSTTINGNLVVTGTTVTANVTSINVKDPIMELGMDPNANFLVANDGKDRGLVLHYHNTFEPVDAFMGWKSDQGEFVFAQNTWPGETDKNIVIINSYGNIRAGNAILGNSVKANYFTGTLTTSDQSNITKVGVLETLTVSGALIAGNALLGNLVTANFFSGRLVTANQPNITRLGNLDLLNVAGPVYADSIDLLGNVNASNANLGNLVSANYFQGTLTTNAQPNITSVGTLTNLTVSGNVTASNANLGNLVVANFFTGTLRTNAQPNITSVGTLVNLSVAGNVTASNANLGNLVIANFYTGTLTTAAQPNITSVGSLVNLSVVGNVTSGNLNTGIISATGNISTSANLTVVGDASLTNLTALGNVSVTSNVSANNLNLSNNISSNNISVTRNANVGNINATGNIVAAGTLSVTGNASAANLIITSNINANNLTLGGAANITGNAIIGNVSTGILAATGNASIGGSLSVEGKANINNDVRVVGAVTAEGDIVARNFSTIGNITASDNVTVGKTLTVSNNANVTTNLTAGNLITSGILQVAGNGSINSLLASGSITAQTNLDVGQDLTVGDDATITSNLYVLKTSYVNSLSASNNISVTRNVTAGNLSSLNNLSVANIATAGNLFVTNTVLNHLIPNANISYTIGNATNRWDEVYLGNDGIHIGTNDIIGDGNTVQASGNIRALGNITSSNNVYTINVEATGNIIATNANLGNLVVANFYTGTLRTNAQPNITSVGRLTGLTVGNATANSVFGNGTIDTTGNVSIGAFLTVTSNVTAGNVSGTGLISAGDFGTGGNVLALGNITGGNIYTAGVFQAANLAGENIKSFGNANIDANVRANHITSNHSITGNTLTINQIINTANITSTNTLIANNSNISNLNITTKLNVGAVSQLKVDGGQNGYVLSTDGAGNLSWVYSDSASGENTYVQFNDAGVLGSENEFTYNKTTGVLTAPIFSGNGSQLTNIDAASLTGIVASATTATTAATVINGSQPNITSVGILSNLEVSGNITSTGRVLINGRANISNIANVHLPGGTNGQVIRTDGDGNLSWYTIPSIAPGGLDTYVQFNDNGVFTGDSKLTFAKATGKLTATTFAGSGAELTNIPAANIVGTIASATSATTATTATSATTAGTVTTAAQPNITSVGTLRNLVLSNAGFTESDRLQIVGQYGARTGLYAGTGYTSDAGGNITDMYSTVLTKSGEQGTGLFMSDLQSQFTMVVDRRASHIFDSTGTISPTFTNRTQNLGTRSGGVWTVKNITGTPVGAIAFNTYNNVAQASTSGSGTGARFDVYTQTQLAPFTGQEYRIRVRSLGTGYAANNTITIAGTSLGGTSPANDLTFTVNSITADRYWRNAHLGDVVMNNGVGNWTLMAGTDGLYLYNNSNGQKYLISMTLVSSGTGPNPLGQ